MVYMGSKNILSKELIPIITKNLKEDQYYVEPFVGGANLIDKIEHSLKIGAYNNKYLIALFNELKAGWTPPEYVTKEEYLDIKENKDNYPDYLVGYVGFNCSYNGVFMSGYKGNNVKTKEKVRHYQTEAKNNVLEQLPNLKSTIFIYSDYQTLEIPPKSVIYCNPPYNDTTEYKTGEFNYFNFWVWCRQKVNEGHEVFISEYNAPDDFICIWEKESNLGSTAKKVTEKLFKHKSQV